MRQVVALSGALFFVATGVARAAPVGINFSHGDFTSTSIDAGENTATLNGLTGTGAPVWTNAPILGAGSIASGRSAGTASGVGYQIYAANQFAAGSETLFNGSDASQQAFRVYADDGDGANSYRAGDGVGVSIELSGMSALMAANNATSYQLTVLFSRDVAGGSFAPVAVRQGNLNDDNSTDIATLALLGSVSPILPAGDGNYPTGTGSGGNSSRTFGQLGGLTADQVTLAAPSNPGNGVRTSLAGVIITPIPEPGTLGLFGLATVGLLRRSRRRA